MVTSAGLHALVGLIGNTDTPVDFTYIGFGSGTSAAAAGDTTLGSEAQRGVATVTVLSVLKPRDTMRFTANITAAADGTLAEIGVFTASSNGTMLLRTLTPKALPYLAGAIVTVTANVTLKNSTTGTGATW
jgi:DNA helicase HerA-like ATPase